VVAVDKKLRRKLVRNLAHFCEVHGLHGVDYNWEYPTNREEWGGLFALLKATKKEFDKRGLTATMAYYPDGQQEKILAEGGVDRYVAFVHSMAYDQPGQHSTLNLAVSTLRNTKEAGLPYPTVTLGLPFYGRHTRTGDWKTFEDLAKEHPAVGVSGGGDEVAGYFFNGPDTIRRKVQMARSSGVGGVMIWEVGQDFHPDDERSLLKAIAAEVWPGGRPKPGGGGEVAEKEEL
jgi:chitinase